MSQPIPAESGASLHPATRDRILEGAVRAVARHGLAKLGMSDVSRSAGVSRGTLYRYFPTREQLLDALARREAARFLEQTLAALEAAPPGETRLHVMLDYATRHVRTHPALRRLLESEPGFVLESLREGFAEIRDTITAPLLPLLADTHPVRSGAVTAPQLADWMFRLLVSLYLFDDPDPEGQAQALAAVYRRMANP